MVFQMGRRSVMVVALVVDLLECNDEDPMEEEEHKEPPVALKAEVDVELLEEVPDKALGNRLDLTC